MPRPIPKATKSFKSADALGAWLQKNHASESELWVKVFKKASRIPSVTWNEIVTVSLCWGWIDGIKKSLGKEAYLQRISPRTTRSRWSKRNTEQVEQLIKSGRMQEPGMAQVRAARQDGRWDAAYAPSSETEVPDDFLVALKRHPKAQRFFGTLGRSPRYVIAYGLSTAKRPDTRQRRFDNFIGMLNREEQPDFFRKKT